METTKISTSGILVAQNPANMPLTKEPSDLAMAEPKPEVLSLAELFEYRQHLREDKITSVSLETQFHSRISFTIAPFIMTMLVLPFGLRFPRAGGIARGISIGVILGLLYWAAHSAMTNAGISGHISPAMAAWSTDAVMLGSGILLMTKRRKTYG